MLEIIKSKEIIAFVSLLFMMIILVGINEEEYSNDDSDQSMLVYYEILEKEDFEYYTLLGK